VQVALEGRLMVAYENDRDRKRLRAAAELRRDDGRLDSADSTCPASRTIAASAGRSAPGAAKISNNDNTRSD